MLSKQLKKAVITILMKSNLTITDEIVDMIVETACVESECGKYIQQINGPACGIFQIEPNTAKDIINNYTNYRPLYKNLLNNYYIKSLTLEQNLCYNLAYQIIICRMFYLRIKEAIPSTVEERAKYWKKYYNTLLGKGTVELYINKVRSLYV